MRPALLASHRIGARPCSSRWHSLRGELHRMPGWMCSAVNLRKWLSSTGCGTLGAWSLREKFATPGHDRIRNIVLPRVVPARVSCLAAAKPYGHLIRAVSTARFAHLIYKGSRAPLACAIRIAARRIGYCRDAHAVTLNVNIC